MTCCIHVYCRAPLPDGAQACARCGHPVDAQRLRDPRWLMQAAQALPRPVQPILDMHQILVQHPMALPAQLMVMDGLGIERALLQSAPPQASSLQGNEALAKASRDNPGRFITSWYVDPRSPDALDELQRGADSGARLVKLLPVAGYRLDDPALLPFWEAVDALGLALLVHTGFITARHKAEEAKAGAWFNASLGDPLQVDQPARRFPNVTIILAHSGGAIFHEAGAQLLTQHDNVWGDISGFGLFALQRWLRLGTTLDWGKVVWGNDSVFYHYPCNLRLLAWTLEQAGAEDLAPGLLRDSGRALIEALEP